MSLGITIQTQAYYMLKKLGGDPVMNYLEYALAAEIKSIASALDIHIHERNTHPKTNRSIVQAIRPKPNHEAECGTVLFAIGGRSCVHHEKQTPINQEFECYREGGSWRVQCANPFDQEKALSREDGIV